MAMSQQRCPVCTMLPLDGPPLGIEAPPFEYYLEHDQTELNKYKGHCDVYRLVQNLHRAWLEGVEGDLLESFSSCGPQHFSVCTDPGIWDVLPASSEAVVHPDPLDPATISRIRTWIERCDEKHDERCHGQGLPFLPTRILDLGASEATEIVKLTESFGQRGQYIALSHCWGTSNSFLTTRDTIKSMKNGFLPTESPATFRNAVTLARHLKIRYLWIDSLCIIQGDIEDWNIESSRMRDVYRNAHLTIAAANAADDAQGFLKSRPKIQCSLKVVAPAGQTANVYLRPQENRVDDRIQPLDTRGWALQETYLSRRQLKFLNNKILWHCQSAQWDESYQDDTDPKYQYGTPFSVTQLFPDRNSSNQNSYQSWYNMIESFSTRQFSILTDRLPALSGLVAMVATGKSGIYCAGLWWEDIGYAICWETDSRNSFRPTCYISPSWSWASIIGPIFYRSSRSLILEPHILTCVTFHDHQITPRGSNSYGEVECAWLQVEAPLAPLARTTITERKGDLEDGNTHEYFSITSINHTGELLEVDFDYEKESHDNLFALFILQDIERRLMGRRRTLLSDEVQLSGLVVRPTLNPETYPGQYGLPSGLGLYERVGFFRFVMQAARGEVIDGASMTNVVLL